MDEGELTGGKRDRRLRKKEKDNAEAQSPQRNAEKENPGGTQDPGT